MRVRSAHAYCWPPLSASYNAAEHSLRGHLCHCCLKRRTSRGGKQGHARVHPLLLIQATRNSAAAKPDTIHIRSEFNILARSTSVPNTELVFYSTAWHRPRYPRDSSLADKRKEAHIRSSERRFQLLPYQQGVRAPAVRLHQSIFERRRAAWRGGGFEIRVQFALEL